GPAGELYCSTNCNKEVEQLAGSLSIRHMPTGLFFTGAAGTRDMKKQDAVASGIDVDWNWFGPDSLAIQRGRSSNYDSSFFYLSGGIARNFLGLGDTVLYGEYREWKGNGQ